MSSTITVFAPQVITADTNSGSLALPTLALTVVGYLNVTAVSGTSPTMTVALQDSPDGVDWYNVPSGAFGVVTAVGKARLALPLTPVGPYLRVSVTVGGTSPSFTASLTCQLVD